MKNISPESIQLLVTTVQELSLARDLDTVMKIVRTAARQLTGADGATFVLRDGDLCFYAEEDAISPLWKGSRFPMNTCISGWAMLNRRSTVIEDIYKDDRIPAEAYKPTFVKSLAMVPIRTIDPIGAIGNYWAVAHKPTEDEVWLLQSLADITALTMENVRVYNELEQRVQQRTAQLETINKELEAFSYSVSHDLRAPLRAISSYSRLLLENAGNKNDAEGSGLVAKIIRSAGNMNNLIDDLLRFFKTGKTEPVKYLVSMDIMVEDIIRQVQEQEKTRKITFSTGELPKALADASLVKLVWENLISNAVKYTRQQPEAKITIGYSNTGNGYAYFVKDNGAGFDMKYQHKLFNVFQRLHTADEFEGTGIGLAIVQRIIAAHGGKVWADAKPGEGACFYFTLPGREPIQQ